ncbi:hypothetical protein BKA62DRAFT_676589 [Auriculariales sp. MPI-PUGE-AT-0066]|nr:hypothetical protein BKA62DRAFT_676589 [Auriculariales sp. MPI-PUGE-AT-0066]
MLIIKPDLTVIWTPQLGSDVDWDTLQLPDPTMYSGRPYTPIYGGIAPDPTSLSQLEYHKMSSYDVLTSPPSVIMATDAPSSSLFGSETTMVDYWDFLESVSSLALTISDEVSEARPKLSRATRQYIEMTTGSFPKSPPRMLPVPPTLRGEDTFDEPCALMATAAAWAQHADTLLVDVVHKICEERDISQSVYDNIHFSFRYLGRTARLLQAAKWLLDNAPTGNQLRTVDPGRQHLDNIECWLAYIGESISDANLALAKQISLIPPALPSPPVPQVSPRSPSLSCSLSLPPTSLSSPIPASSSRALTLAFSSPTGSSSSRARAFSASPSLSRSLPSPTDASPHTRSLTSWSPSGSSFSHALSLSPSPSRSPSRSFSHTSLPSSPNPARMG